MSSPKFPEVYPVTMNKHGALLHQGKMIARIVYGDDGLREALRAAAEEHVNTTVLRPGDSVDFLEATTKPTRPGTT